MAGNEIEEVKQKTDIIELISAYISLKKAGRNYKALCPFHHEKTPSFMVSPELQIFKCFGCFPPGQLIKTARGLHPIEEAREGQDIISGKGEVRKVLGTHARLYEGNVVEVVTRMLNQRVVLTEDHQVFTLGQGYTRQYKNLSRRLKGYKELDPDSEAQRLTRYFPLRKVSAGNLQPGHCLVYPINKEVKDQQLFDLTPYYTKVLPKHGTKPRRINLVVPVERDFLELVGWYVAEGSTHRAYLRFSFGSQEKKKAYEVYGIVKRLFGLRASFHYRRGGKSGLELTVCHSQLANIFDNLCGRGAENKHLPFAFQFLPPEKQAILLRAYWRGDGSSQKRSGRVKHRRYAIATISRILSEQLRDILLRLGYFPCLYETPARVTNDGVNHRVSYQLSWPVSTRSQKYNLTYRDRDGSLYWVLPVRSVAKRAFAGAVYNLNVEGDHSYVANSFAVANCGEGGDVFAFVQKMEGLDFAGALHFLADRVGVKLTTTRPSPQAQKKEQFYKINDLAAEYFHFLLTEHKIGREAKAYLKNRGMESNALDKFQLGYAPRSWDSLTKFLLKKKFSLGDVLSVGLALPQEGGRGYYDRFRGRIMFPLKDASGRVVGFSGRVLHEKEEPKYLNSPETELFKKSEMLYGLDLAKSFIRKENLAVVVEGQTDMITPFLAGTKNIVASLGTALTLGQISLLRRFTENVALCFDTDLAGDSATRRGIELAEEAGLSVKVITLPPGAKDPDECVRKNWSSWRQALDGAENVYDFLFSAAARQFAVQDPAGKKKISRYLLPLIGGISNEILKMHYLRRLATLLGVGEETVVKELNRLERLGEVPVPAGQGPVAPLSGASAASRPELLQEDFLALLLAAPLHLTQSFLGKVGQKDFLAESSRALFAEIKSYYQRRKQPVKIKVLYDKIPIALRPALQHLYLRAEQSYVFLPERELHTLLGGTMAAMKKEAVKQRLQTLSASIKELEKAGSGPAGLKKVQKEFQALSAKLKEE